MNKLLLITRRELKELRRNRTFFQTMAVFPVLMVLLPTATVLFFNVVITDFAAAHAQTTNPANCDQLGGLQACDKAGIVAGLMSICFSFFLPVPAVLPMTIAAYSVVGEKERRSLEPLLATPLRTNSLLLGKSLSAILPTVFLCWFSFGALVLILRLLLSEVIFTRIDVLLWLATIGLWTPLLAFVTTMVGVTISARARDARAAQQYGSLMALPVVGIVIGIALGFFNMTWLLLGLGLVFLIALCGLTYWMALGLFQRETILTRWK
ncbi:MAG TPA: ABC transporter permease subunit [Chloroflexia bacterium]|nr:ABC transporter permease subunit [Chloroflexia bacterium]